MIANATTSEPTGIATDSHRGWTRRRSSFTRRVPPAMSSPISSIDAAPALELADDLALVDDEDPVGERADLVEVLAHEQDRNALCSGVAEVRMHRLDRADVEPARRLGDDEDERIVLELSPEDRASGGSRPRDRGPACPDRASSRRSAG